MWRPLPEQRAEDTILNLVWRLGKSEYRYGVREVCGIHLSQKYRRSHTRSTPDCPSSCIEFIRSTITDQSLTHLERRLPDDDFLDFAPQHNILRFNRGALG